MKRTNLHCVGMRCCYFDEEKKPIAIWWSAGGCFVFNPAFKPDVKATTTWAHAKAAWRTALITDVRRDRAPQGVCTL